MTTDQVAAGSKLEPTYADAYTAWRTNPSKENLAKLFKAIDPIIERHASSLPGANPAVMRNKAKLLIAKSLGRYDPTVTNLNTFLSRQLLGLRREGRKGNPTNIIHVPEHQALANNRIHDARLELTNTLDRPPTDEELADHLGMSVDHVREYGTITRGLSEGVLTAPQDTGEGSSSKQSPAITSPVSSQARMDYVYGELNPTDRIIFTHTPEYCDKYNNKPMTSAEMSKELNRSQAWISNRRSIIQQKLEEADKLF